MNILALAILGLVIFGFILGTAWYVPSRLSRLSESDKTVGWCVAYMVTVMASAVAMGSLGNATGSAAVILSNISGLVFFLHLSITLTLIAGE